MSLSMRVREHSGVLVIDLLGRLTLGEGPTRLKDIVRGLLQEGRRRFCLNLGGLTYMDSCGVGLLVETYATVNREAGRLTLASLNRRIQDLLLITKLCTVFEIYDSEADAVESFQVSAR